MQIIENNIAFCDRYAVIGNPIHHSKSPRIHTMFAAQTGQNIKYSRILGKTNCFAAQVREFFDNGGKGLNVTLPFKQDAYRLADQCSAIAEIAEAANTLMMANGKIFADNTDGLGIVRDFVYNHRINFTKHTILLLGAGGAAYGIIGSLLAQRPAHLFIANRTPTKAIALANKFVSYPVLVKGGGFEDLKNQHFDIIINATSTELSGEQLTLPQGCLINDGVVYDMLYADAPTAFVRWGVEHGARVAVDGLGMLVEQAAEAFLLWRGVRPNTSEVIKNLRDCLR